MLHDHAFFRQYRNVSAILGYFFEQPQKLIFV
jgi:hypothetical protein